MTNPIPRIDLRSEVFGSQLSAYVGIDDPHNGIILSYYQGNSGKNNPNEGKGVFCIVSGGGRSSLENLIITNWMII